MKKIRMRIGGEASGRREGDPKQISRATPYGYGSSSWDAIYVLMTPAVVGDVCINLG